MNNELLLILSLVDLELYLYSVRLEGPSERRNRVPVHPVALKMDFRDFFLNADVVLYTKDALTVKKGFVIYGK